MSTRLVNRESISLGLAELYLGDSDSLITQTTRVLTSTNYFGAKTDVSFSCSREYVKRYETDGNIQFLMDHLLTRVDISISIQFIEIYNKTISYALGGNGIDTDLMAPLIDDPVKLRAELVFTYPNKTNQMILIFPRTQIVTPDFDLTFNSEDAMAAPLVIKALRTDNENWSTRPLGKSIFV